MLPDARGYRIDNGAENYRRFLRGDEEGIAEIVRAYKDGLIFYLNGYVNDISLRFMPYRKRLPETLLLETNIRGKREKGQKPQRNGDFRKKNAVSLWEDYKIDFFAFCGLVFVPLRKILSFQG